MRRRPYSVILLDEVEKAHPDVFNVLLQIMEDGRMTDGHGRVVGFRNTIVIMTSNVGSDWILSESDDERIRDKVMEAVRSTFKPEFLNRVDEIVVFHRLTREQIADIVDIQIEKLAERLAGRKLGLSLTEAAKNHLADRGYDPSFGARPLRRLIQNDVANGIALAVLQGKFRESDTVEVDAKDGELVFSWTGGEGE